MSALDFSPLLSAIDHGTLVLALLALGGILIVPRLVRMAVSWIKASVEDAADYDDRQAWGDDPDGLLSNADYARRR